MASLFPMSGSFTLLQNGLFCFVCQLFGEKDNMSKCVTCTGFNDWKHANVCITEHDGSEAHRKCMLTWISRTVEK